MICLITLCAFRVFAVISAALNSVKPQKPLNSKLAPVYNTLMASYLTLTVAFSGLLHLTLSLATKFPIGIPFLAPGSPRRTDTHQHEVTLNETEGVRKQNVAAPLYLTALVLIPFGAAIYIVSTLFSDGNHHGFDVIISSITGSICGHFGFRWYHLPITRGGGR
jgi:hypothetical protein